MRVVLGDLGWKMLPEPRDYNLAHYLGSSDMPNRDKEAAMLEEVSE